MFDALPPDQIAAVTAALRERRLDAGELLFAEGDAGHELFIVLDGQLAVVKSSGTSDERLLGKRGPGAFVGELSLLGIDTRRTASARADTPVHLLQMSRSELHTLLERYPALSITMLRVLAERLSAAHNGAIKDLHERNERLAQAYAELQAAQAQLIEKEKLERDLQVAYEIQMSILPRTMPVMAGYGFGATMVPARIVGGDFFDFIPLSETALGIAIGDVTDKGLPAAIFMAQARALLRAEASRAVSPREALERVNQHLLQMNNAGLFVTVLYGVLDIAMGQFRYGRAGHELPLLVDSSGEVMVLPRGMGMALGLVDAPPIDEQTVMLEPGSTLLLYTDGVTEAHDPQYEEFGVKRLAVALDQHCQAPVATLCDRLLASIADFQASAPTHDDITLLVVRAQAGKM